MSHDPSPKISPPPLVEGLVDLPTPIIYILSTHVKAHDVCRTSVPECRKLRSLRGMGSRLRPGAWETAASDSRRTARTDPAALCKVPGYRPGGGAEGGRVPILQLVEHDVGR